jgi:hypothetical protein
VEGSRCVKALAGKSGVLHEVPSVAHPAHNILSLCHHFAITLPSLCQRVELGGVRAHGLLWHPFAMYVTSICFFSFFCPIFSYFFSLFLSSFSSRAYLCICTLPCPIPVCNYLIPPPAFLHILAFRPRSSVIPGVGVTLRFVSLTVRVALQLSGFPVIYCGSIAPCSRHVRVEAKTGLIVLLLVLKLHVSERSMAPYIVSCRRVGMIFTASGNNCISNLAICFK